MLAPGMFKNFRKHQAARFGSKGARPAAIRSALMKMGQVAEMMWLYKTSRFSGSVSPPQALFHYSGDKSRITARLLLSIDFTRNGA